MTVLPSRPGVATLPVGRTLPAVAPPRRADGPRPAGAGESHFLLVFAHQRRLHLPRFAHTFAMFVRATGDDAEAGPCDVEAHTISWSPATLSIRLTRRRPEPGVNLDLEESLRWARSLEARVSCWGPFEIRRELYERALAQIARLRAGGVGFKAVDTGFRPRAATNCIHAISDLDPDHGLLRTGPAYGDAASYLVARHLRRWMLDPGRTCEAVYERLGLGAQAIVRRGRAARPAHAGSPSRFGGWSVVRVF